MAWQTVMTTMVRHLINDLSSTKDYEDARIQEGLVVAGIIVSQDYDYTYSYTFDVDNVSISPDPVSNSDYPTIALITLKAACILDIGKYRDAAGDGISVKDGDTQIDLSKSFAGYRDIIKSGPCSSYQKLLDKVATKRSMNAGTAVLTPLTHEDYSLTGQDYLSRRSTTQFFDSFVSW
ncbi:MAG: hypothetical protein BAJALOKI3v1_50135 [Promethearchaeota archaeon]|nr:MAG: hypothetical protein BAJALOKI3v1_50135 [Candidatus Lokiarchaeota archaeon]